MEPIFFVSFFEEAKWGSNRIAELFDKYQKDKKISVSWEISAVQYRQTIVRAGKYAGATLSELYSGERNLFGTKSPFFPFVIKFIDSDEQAHISVHGGGMKDDGCQYEGWYIISSEPESEIVVGTKLKNKHQFYGAISDDTIMDSAYLHNSKIGECFLIPPGVPHAIGAGVLLYEISSPLRESPRIYGLEYSEDESTKNIVDSILFMEEVKPTTSKKTSENTELLLTADYFTLEKVCAESGVSLRAEKTFSAFTALGRGVVSGKDYSYKYNAGETFIMPAGDEEFILSGGELLKATPVEDN